MVSKQTAVVFPSDHMLWNPWQMPIQKKPSSKQWNSPLKSLSYLHKQLRNLRQQLNVLEKEMDEVKRKVGKKCELEFVGEETTPEKLVFHYPLGRDVKPEEISVSIKDHRMTIEIKKERKSPSGDWRRYEERMRRFPLPKYINVKEVQTSLTPEGYLRIEATLPKEKLHLRRHEHPREHERENIKSELTPEGYLRVATPTKDEHEMEGERGREIPVEVSGSSAPTEEEKPSGCLQH